MGMGVLPKVSTIKRTFQAICVKELRELKLIAENLGDVAKGQQMSERTIGADSTMAQSAERLVGIVVINSKQQQCCSLIIEHTILLQILTSNIEHLTSLILLEN